MEKRITHFIEKRIIIFKVTAVIIGMILFFPVGIVTATFIHEASHVLAASILGVHVYAWDLNYTYYEPSSNGLVNLQVNLAGGLGEALFAFVFFLCIRYFFFSLAKAQNINTTIRAASKQIEARNLLGFLRPFRLFFLFGVELEFLAITFLGILNSVLEGFFNYNYNVAFVPNLGLVFSVIVLCILLAFGTLYNRQSKYLKV